LAWIHSAESEEIAPEDMICPEEDFDDRELSIIRYMAKEQGLKYRELTGQQMHDLLGEYEDCEEWQLSFMCS
jgi:hypothetical protein